MCAREFVFVLERHKTTSTKKIHRHGPDLWAGLSAPISSLARDTTKPQTSSNRSTLYTIIQPASSSPRHSFISCEPAIQNPRIVNCIMHHSALLENTLPAKPIVQVLLLLGPVLICIVLEDFRAVVHGGAVAPSVVNNGSKTNASDREYVRRSGDGGAKAMLLHFNLLCVCGF